MAYYAVFYNCRLNANHPTFLIESVTLEQARRVAKRAANATGEACYVDGPNKFETYRPEQEK